MDIPRSITAFSSSTYWSLPSATASSIPGSETRSAPWNRRCWAGCAALLCYPPLVWLTANALGWFSFELPQFRSLAFQHTAAVAMLLGVGVYAWASLAMGLRASNLTNRGIVTTGPYRLMRHPAYVAKNISWWIGDSAAPEARLHRSLAPGPRIPGNGGLERDLRAAGVYRRAAPRERSRLPGLPLAGSLALHPGVDLTFTHRRLREFSGLARLPRAHTSLHVPSRYRRPARQIAGVRACSCR